MKTKYKFGVIITLIVLLFGAILVSGCVSSGGDNVDNDSPIEGKWYAVIEQPRNDWDRGADGLFLHETREVTLDFKRDGSILEKDVMNFYTYNPSTGKDTAIGSPFTNNFDEIYYWQPVSLSEYALFWTATDKVAGKMIISDDGNSMTFDSYGAFILGHAFVNPVNFTSVKERKPLYDASTQTAKDGDTVSVFYTLTVDGIEKESNFGANPLTFTIGAGTMIKGFNDGVIGMKAGETKTIEVSPENGYGIYSKENVTELPLSDLKEALGTVSVGDIVEVYAGNTMMNAEILSINEGRGTADAAVNHPLAGKTLTFTIQLDTIKPGK